MTISSIDTMLAGCQSPQSYCKVPNNTGARLQSFWGLPGIPGAGSFNTTLNGGTYSSTGGLVAGQIPHTDPGGGLLAYLARLTMGTNAATSTGGLFLVLDRLWDNGGITITSTSAQNIVSPAFPSRDAGAIAHGPLLAVEVSATVGAVAPTLTISYTNLSSVAGRTSTNIPATAANSQAGSFILMSLQSGDTGVKSVESITLSASWVSGTINVVAFHVIGGGFFTVSGGAVDCITGGFPRVYNGAVPFLVHQATIQPPGLVFGHYIEAQG